MLQPGLLPQQAVVPSLEVARVTFHCQQCIFVVTNDYVWFSSLETYSGAKQCHQFHCVGCNILVFTLGAGQRLCAPFQREGPQLLQALDSMASTHQWVSINASVLPISRFLSVTTRSKWVICSPGSCCNLLWKTNPAVLKLPYK